jgi:hypothetical protein
MGSQFIESLCERLRGIGAGKTTKRGTVHLESDVERFVKSMLPSKTVAGALTANGAVMHVAKVGGTQILDSGFKKISVRKRAAMPLVSLDPNVTPAVNARPGANDRPGLSDSDLTALENTIDDNSLTPQQATVRWLEVYRIMAANVRQTAADLVALNLRGRA